jgi:hypothetical protein
VSDAERSAHRDFIATLGGNAIWQDYLPRAAGAAPAARSA